ncbi:MAG: PaaI family thioesterase [Desulfovibrionaceae bacterium]|nr:PaaI family thioesterase [Desulfovibrionaceae bacterium]MDD4951080.1 PaaI family thioesterase [Desulfovibrionaceae bacterium]
MDKHERVRAFFSRNDKLAGYLGMELVSVGRGTATAKLKLRDIHMNAAGLAHGGTVFSLADFAFGAAANSSGKMALGVNMSISFIKPGESGVLTAVAREVSAGSRLASYAVEVSDDSGQVIAAFQGLVYRKRDDLPL